MTPDPSPAIKVAPWLATDFSALQTDPVYVAEGVILDICEQIHTAMNAQGISQKSLAKKLGKTESAISQLLSGDQNISIRRLVEVALALGMTITPPQLVPYAPPAIETFDDGCGARMHFTLDQHALVDPATWWHIERRSARSASPSFADALMQHQDAGSEVQPNPLSALVA